MGEEDDEDHNHPHPGRPPSNTSSSGQKQRTHPRLSSKGDSRHNETVNPTRGGRRSRPGRSERQRRPDEHEQNSQMNVGGSSNLNPTASAFVPRFPAETSGSATQGSSRGQGRGALLNGERNVSGGSRGRYRGRGQGRNQHHQEAPQRENEHAGGGTSSARTRNKGPRNAKFRVQPKELKESEDLMQRMTEALIKGDYDCSICTDIIQRYKPVWSCKVCWTVFHRSCIKKWATHLLGEGPVWRCPGCQSPSETVPNEYRCWCGKVENPEVDRLATPHSCSQPCLRKRKSGCACTLPCHPGPCPPCYQVHAPPEKCFCGKEERLVRCVDYDPEAPGWSCARPCEMPLDCNLVEVNLSEGKMERHVCQLHCHDGPCPPCQIKETVFCYCGKSSKEIACSDKEIPKKSDVQDGDISKSWLGYYQCPEICGEKFDCGIHSCEQRCHPKDTEPKTCPRSPENVKFCPCGKTHINDLTQRTTCEDPIPTCTKQCQKPLRCGHFCESTCHLDDCPPCKLTVSATCRCGQTRLDLVCSSLGEEELLCDKPCTAMKSCGRHHCNTICCPGDHLCTKLCNRPLKCGSHNCSLLCHRGSCPTCLEASFEPLVCTCGKTELPPPIRCGTKMPQCPFQCVIEPACGHPKVPHGCHPPDEECPKCPYLVEKVCMCGKRTVRNQPCFRAQAGGVSCGMACGALMPCGYHRCPAICHVHSGNNVKCTEKCGKPRKSCGHACQLKCHSPSACDESTPCQAKVIVRCDCGLRKQEIECLATSTESSRGLQNLPCNDLCARTERNRKLAEALDIDTTASFHEPENVKGGYQLCTLDFFVNNRTWCLEIEGMFREFLASNSMRLAFKPMTAQKREFVHELADAYGFDSESVDQEPYRSVEIYRNSRATLPRHTLSDAAKLKGPQITNNPSTNLVQMRKFTPGIAYNAIFLESVKGTVLQADLQTALNPILRQSKLLFSLKYVNNGKDVLLSPGPTTLPIEDVETALHNVVKPVKQYIQTSSIAVSAELCWVNREGQVSYRESTKQAKKLFESSGAPIAPWSKYLTPKVETSNSYDPLSGGGTSVSAPEASVTNVPKKKKKQEQEVMPVLDDWEKFEE